MVERDLEEYFGDQAYGDFVLVAIVESLEGHLEEGYEPLEVLQKGSLRLCLDSVEDFKERKGLKIIPLDDFAAAGEKLQTH